MRYELIIIYGSKVDDLFLAEVPELPGYMATCEETIAYKLVSDP